MIGMLKALCHYLKWLKTDNKGSSTLESVFIIVLAIIIIIILLGTATNYIENYTGQFDTQIKG